MTEGEAQAREAEMTRKHQASAPLHRGVKPAATAAWSDLLQSAGASWISAFDRSSKAFGEVAAAQAKFCCDRWCIGVSSGLDPTLGQAILRTELLMAERQVELVGDALLKIGGPAPDLAGFRPLPD